MEETKEHVLFIVNPRAGITIKSKLLIRILAGYYLDSARYNPEIQFTRHAGHATELAREALGKGTKIIVAVGGDGTINEVARALVDTSAVMGILPTGSGNGLALHLRIPMNLLKALRVINIGNYKAIDTVDLNGRIFTSIAGIGFDAAVAEKFAGSGIRGLFSYIRIILKEFGNYTPKTYRLEIDDQVVVRNALMISFANSDQFGFHSRIAPQAVIDDGWIDISIIRKPSLIKAFKAAPRLFFGTFGKAGFVEYFRGKQVCIPGSSNSFINLDGEAVKIEEDLKMKINPKSLRVIVK